MTRGIRNCNPLNIRRTKDVWQGLRPVQTDPDFCQFVKNSYGFRAGFVILNKYMKRGWTTVAQIIEHWAPPTENHTQSYISAVCRKTHLTPSTEIDIKNENRVVLLVWGMAWVECCFTFPIDEIYSGYRLFSRDFLRKP